MTRCADADKLLALFSFDDDPELSHLNESGRVPTVEQRWTRRTHGKTTL